MTNFKRRSSVFRAFFGALLLAALVLGVTACGSSSSSSSSSSEETTTAAESNGGGSETASATEESGSSSVEGKTATIVGSVATIPYGAKEEEVMTKGLEAAGVKVTLLQDEFLAAEEAAHLNQAVAQHTDVILWVGNAQEAAHAPVQKANEAGIPVILVGTVAGPTIESLETIYVGPSDVVSGELMAKMLAEGLEKNGVMSGKVMLVTGIKGAPAVNARLEGWENGMAKLPQYETVAEPDGGWDPVKAAQVTQPLFAKYGKEIVGVSAFSGSMAAASANSAEQAGLTPGTEKGDMVVAGINCDGTSIEAIKNGSMYGTTSQGPVGESEIAVETAIELLEGKEVPDEVGIPNEPIYKSNVAKYEEECNY